MRFLGVLGLGFVLAGERRVALAEFGRDDVADMADRFGNDLDAVGSHVGDEADRLAADVDAFVEALGDLHRLLGREAELARGVHLQRRGRERRIRVALRGFLFDRSDAEILPFDRRLDGAGRGLVLDVELLECRAVDGDEAGFDLLVLGRGEQGLDRPVFLRPEGLDLGLAVADEPQRHRLDAACRAGARQLAPEHGRQREADEIVERAARQIGGNQRLIDLARLFHRRKDRLLGDGVEGDALDLGTPFFSAFFSFRIRRMCQEMASPSRSGSVARISLSAFLTASAISRMIFWDLPSTSQCISKSLSGSTEPFFAGRSRTCP